MIYKKNNSDELIILDEGGKYTNWFGSDEFGDMRTNYLTNPMEHNIRLKLVLRNVPGYAFDFPINPNTGDIIYKDDIERNNLKHMPKKYNKLKRLAQDIAYYNRHLMNDFYAGNSEVFSQLDARTQYIGCLKESKRKEILNA